MINKNNTSVIKHHWHPMLASLSRLLLALVWLISGYQKGHNIPQTRIALAAYQVFPAWSLDYLSYAVPTLEILLGIALLLGVGTRIAALLSALLLLSFIVLIATVWARGLKIDCGCFGGGGAANVTWVDYFSDIVRDGLLLLCAFVLVWYPWTVLAVSSRSRFSFHDFTNPTDKTGSEAEVQALDLEALGIKDPVIVLPN